MPANMETDPFFILLTDALRAGPGSSQWQEAVASLRQQGVEGADEHRLLLETRENLQAGQDYRAVRAGPGFTRKVMAGIEEENSAAGKRNGVPTATLIAILCGIIILCAIGFVVWHMTNSPNPSAATAVDDLESKSQRFFDKVANASFAGSMPDGWKTIGSLKLSAADGLEPAEGSDSKNQGGGVVLSQALPGNQPFAVDVTLHAPKPTASVLLEAFVTTDANFNADKGTSSHDLVWQLRNNDAEDVLVNGAGALHDDAPPKYHPGDTVRVIVGKDVAIIETVPKAGGAPIRLWSGKHELGDGPRYVGVRFLQTGAAGKADVRVKQITVTTSAR